MYLISDNGGITFWSELKSWFTEAPASKYDGMDLRGRLTDVTENDTLAKYNLKTNTGGSYALKNEEQMSLINSALTSNQRDAVLVKLYGNNLWNNIATYNDYSKDSINPSKMIGNVFDINIAKGTAKFYSTIQGGNARGSTGCSTKNCGDIGAGREGGGRPHFGTDTIAKPGTFTVAGEDGILNITSSPDLPGINIKTDDSIVHQTLYVQPLLKNQTRVEQDDVIGKVVDITVAEKYKHTINHVHEELIIYDYNGYVKMPDETIETGRVKSKVLDSNQILYSNNPNPNGVNLVNEFIRQRQNNLKQLYEQQQNNKDKDKK